jgi:acetyltransferase-like isoleucine patch superfamily enzyme
MKDPWWQYLSPRRFAQGVKNRFFFALARPLAYYLAHVPVFWGDRERIILGKNVTLANTVFNCRSGKIVMEDNVFFGHNCLVLTGRHDFRLRDEGRILTVPDEGFDIIIRRGAWIASAVTLIGPCEIGEHAVVVAGTVVRQNVPPGVIYGGNPAKVIAPIDFKS